jgi:protein gp37
MGKTSIEWTDASWNPVVGCTEISPGCANCYAARLAATRLRNVPSYAGLAAIGNLTVIETDASVKKPPRWTGDVRFLPERIEEPLHWRKPRRIFVCDMGDLFHEAVTDFQLDQIWYVMLKAERHTFQVLTKRPGRMRNFIRDWRYTCGSRNFLPNVWLGVSVENQHFADERIPILLDTPAAVRWLSCEPLLGQVIALPKALPTRTPEIDWIVAGGESGPCARPMHPAWARSLRDQCQAAGVPFFFKQWGAWYPQTPAESAADDNLTEPVLLKKYPSGTWTIDDIRFIPMGKKKAGRLLDGREWNEFPVPEVTA